MSEDTRQVRIGDRERRAVDELLLAAVADGVLTLSEYDERSRELWQARTRGDLDGLVADLPAATPVVPAPRAVPPDDPARSQRVVAVLCEDRFAGSLAPEDDVRGWAVLGRAVVDLRRADLPDGVRVRVRAVLGEVEVQVPPGARVHLSGMSLMGERAVRTLAVPASGPDVHVDAVAVLGAVHVTHGDGTVAAGPLTHMAALHRRASVAVPVRSAVRRRRGGRPFLRGLAGLLVPAAVLGGVLAAGPDAAAVFGSEVAHVAPGQDPVAVSTLFGSVTVVVPDDARVAGSGRVLFGSVDCADACSASPLPGHFEHQVRRLGAFGSIDIVTESEWSAQRSGSGDDEAEDD